MPLSNIYFRVSKASFAKIGKKALAFFKISQMRHITCQHADNLSSVLEVPGTPQNCLRKYVKFLDFFFAPQIENHEKNAFGGKSSAVRIISPSSSFYKILTIKVKNVFFLGRAERHQRQNRHSNWMFLCSLFISIYAFTQRHGALRCKTMVC